MSGGQDLQAFGSNANLLLSGIFDHSASELVIFENQVRVRKKVTIENIFCFLMMIEQVWRR